MAAEALMRCVLRSDRPMPHSKHIMAFLALERLTAMSPAIHRAHPHKAWQPK